VLFFTDNAKKNVRSNGRAGVRPQGKKNAGEKVAQLEKKGGLKLLSIRTCGKNRPRREKDPLGEAWGVMGWGKNAKGAEVEK